MAWATSIASALRRQCLEPRWDGCSVVRCFAHVVRACRASFMSKTTCLCLFTRTRAPSHTKLALTPSLAPQYTKIARGACRVPVIPHYPRTSVIGARRVPLESSAHLERALATLLTLFPCGTVS